MDKFRVNLKNKIDKYIKLSGISYAYFEKNTGSIYGIVKNGSTKFRTLFQVSKILGIDIRNFLMFDDRTYTFKNSFDTFEEFFVFLTKRLKQFRFDRGLKALDVANKLGNMKIDNIYRIESSKSNVSLKRFYEYLEALEITSDEFFLTDEYQIIGNQTKNYISIDEFNNRIYELEGIKHQIIGSDIYINPNNFPTLHGFLKICKSLRVSPKDFFDFEKKEFQDDFKIIDISSSANFIKKKLESNGVKVQRYIKLDAIFLFCNEQNLSITDFFDILSAEGNIDQTNGIILYLSTTVQVS